MNFIAASGFSQASVIAKDAPAFGPSDGRKREKFQDCVRSVLRKSAPLKETSDARLVQEAKNALADLVWVEATF